MAKKLIINQTHDECRIALLENSEIIDFLIRRGTLSEQRHKGSVGDIYLGRITRVLPGMQSAFVDIGLERAAFLYVDDAYLPTLEEQREMAAKIEEKLIEKKVREGEVIPDELSSLSETVDMKFKPGLKIEDFLKEGESVLVQIAKEPISTKGPRVTRHITFAGRHLVYMPFIEHTGVSRRIENEVERERLKEILDSISPEGVGVIARTVAEGQSYKVLKKDYVALVKTWKEIQKNLDKLKAPSNVHKDLSFLQRALRDIVDEDVSEIIVDDKNIQKQIEKYTLKQMPNLKGKIKLYQEESPIFEFYNIDTEIHKAIGDKVPLKSGGSLNIDQTEALVSIDVNTGRFVGNKNLEQTILQTNLEAVEEVAYQLRLRNCGGIIIIDFIDMEQEEHRTKVYESLLNALKKDRAKTNVLPISGLGLVEMTRKRTRDTLTRVLCKTCPYCEGTGRVKTVQTVCYEIIREVIKQMKTSARKKVNIFAHPEVAAQLVDEDFGVIDMLEVNFNKNIVVRADNNYHVEQYEIDG